MWSWGRSVTGARRGRIAEMRVRFPSSPSLHFALSHKLTHPNANLSFYYLFKTNNRQIRKAKTSSVFSWWREAIQLLKPVVHANHLVLRILTPLDHQKLPIFGHIVVSAKIVS